MIFFTASSASVSYAFLGEVRCQLLLVAVLPQCCYSGGVVVRLVIICVWSDFHLYRAAIAEPIDQEDRPIELHCIQYRRGGWDQRHLDGG